MTGMAAPAVIWFRRDLRLRDLPTLLSAADTSDDALALFVVDPALLRPSGAARRAFLAGCLRALDDDLGGRLLIRAGDPVDVVPAVAAQVGARDVHVSADYGPYGSRRDAAVAAALAENGRELVATGSPYAVAPGRVRSSSGGGYRVFTAYRRAWYDHGWRAPADTDASTLHWMTPPSSSDPLPEVDVDATLPLPGEAAARARWADFRTGFDDTTDAPGYATDRDRPDLDATSRLSAYLKFGCLHPRTLLHDLRDAAGDDAATFRSELAWRDFYADVLHHRPETARRNYDARFDALPHDSGPDADRDFEAWCTGRTGYPIVDAGMRQLLAEGWMHNRVRMITASFLTKDLHLPWWRGARHFMTHLVDGDLASNQHGWQWTAGSGTDAAPYFRVFNPVPQGRRFDPDGDYVRRWIPELRGIGGGRAHLPGSGAPGYPAPIVDHATERLAALDRYETIKGR